LATVRTSKENYVYDNTTKERQFACVNSRTKCREMWQLAGWNGARGHTKTQ